MGPIIGMWPMPIGQVAELNQFDSSSPTLVLILLPLAGIVAFVLVIGLPIILGIRSEARRREMEHLERMRAIEVGRPFADEPGWWTPARMAIGIGIGVPIGVFAIGLIAAETSGAAPFIWPSAAAVGVAAVICGTILAVRIPSTETKSTTSPIKPLINPDIYDAAEHQHG